MKELLPWKCAPCSLSHPIAHHPTSADTLGSPGRAPHEEHAGSAAWISQLEQSHSLSSPWLRAVTVPESQSDIPPTQIHIPVSSGSLGMLGIFALLICCLQTPQHFCTSAFCSPDRSFSPLSTFSQQEMFCKATSLIKKFSCRGCSEMCTFRAHCTCRTGTYAYGYLQPSSYFWLSEHIFWDHILISG